MNLEIKRYEPSDETVVIRLWRECGLLVPWNDPRRDIARKLKEHPELFLVGCIDGQVIASLMAGYEGHRGWINYLAVAPAYQRQGIGRRMVREAETLLKSMGCPKINLQVRKSNAGVIEFYKNMGFKPDEVVSMGKRLESDGEGD